MTEIIYILTNKSLKDCVKVGRIKNLEQLINSLDTADLPDPFQCYYAAEMDKASFLEKKINEVFVDKRVNPSKGFFELDPHQVKCVIDIASTQFIFKDVTYRVGKKKTTQKVLQEQGIEQEEEKEEVREMNGMLTVQDVRKKMIKPIQRKLGITLVKVRKMPSVYIDEQTGTAVCLIVSNRDDKSTHNYWYTLYGRQMVYIKNIQRGYVCFGFMDKNIVCLVPIADIDPLLKYCGVTEKRNGYHFYVKSRHDGKLTFYFPKGVPEYDLSKYIIDIA